MDIEVWGGGSVGTATPMPNNEKNVIGSTTTSEASEVNVHECVPDIKKIMGA